MSNNIYYIVDVFAEEKYAGNQLGVFCDAGHLSDMEMQKMAKEMNYSETTFIISEEERDGGYDVRIFTPDAELPFAGHPTLGTAFIIQQEVVQKPVEKIILNLKVGQIPVTFHYKGNQVDVLWMEQIQPAFGQVFETKEIAECLSLQENDIKAAFPVQEVSTGMPAIITPLKTLDAVKRARISRDKFFKLVKNLEAKTILIFSPETYNVENDLNVRFFADLYGVPEDPATGSANGCLVSYLAKHRYFGKAEIDIRVEQGYEIGRRSMLYLKAQDRDGQIDVFVGGKAILIAKGEFI